MYICKYIQERHVCMYTLCLHLCIHTYMSVRNIHTCTYIHIFRYIQEHDSNMNQKPFKRNYIEVLLNKTYKV